jgi:uncharacterized protein
VWDDTHLVFADIRSPRTVANLRRDPRCEINVVDPLVRKGYRFRGRAEVLDAGDRFEEAVAWFEARGVEAWEEAGRRIKVVVLVEVDDVKPLVSPAYDHGASEDEIRSRWVAYWESRGRVTGR